MAAKLHKMLAVHDQIKGQATKVRLESKATLEKSRHLFGESIKTFFPNTPNAEPERIEERTLQTTVLDEVLGVNKYIARAIDIGLQVDLANARAYANIIMPDNSVLAENVPATALLQLEHRLSEIKEYVTAFPTQDPAKGFRPDPDRGPGIYKARDIKKEKTKKEDQPVVVYPATDKHPAQAVLKSYDVPVGHILEQEWSSLIPPNLKSDLLDRVESVMLAVREARSVANETSIDVEGNRIGTRLLEYIYRPLGNSSNVTT